MTYGRRSMSIEDEAPVFRAVITSTYPETYFWESLRGTSQTVAVGPYVSAAPAKAAVTAALRNAEDAKRHSARYGLHDRDYEVTGRVERGRTVWEPLE